MSSSASTAYVSAHFSEEQRVERQSGAPDGEECSAGGEAPAVTWHQLESVLDGKAPIWAAQVEGEKGYREIVLDVSGVPGIRAVDLGRGTVERSQAGESPTAIAASSPITSVVSAPGVRWLGGDENDNSFYGSLADETFRPGTGRDRMHGGAGRDKFFFQRLEDSSSSRGVDAIFEFESNWDQIHIQRTQEMLERGLCWVQGNRFTGCGPEASWINRGCGWWQLSIDNDGDKRTDFELMVQTNRASDEDVVFL